MTDSGRITCFLQSHPKVDQVGENLYVSLGLHGAPHQAKTEPRFILPSYERRDDRMERAFARGIAVWSALLQIESARGRSRGTPVAIGESG